MKPNLIHFLIWTLIFSWSCKPAESTSSSTTPAKKGLPTIASFTEGMDAYSGYFPFYWDNEKGKIYLEIDKVNSEFLYVNSLAAGVGSNDIGLDRGQLGDERVVKFVQHGPKVFMIQPNQDYRAVSDNLDEVKSVQEAFASSIIWGFKAEAKSDWSVLIDITDFLLRDAHNVSNRLSSSEQGSYKVDKSRSALYRENTMNFPKNTEFESIITFTGEPKGYYIRSVAPSADAITVRMHHSFIELPDSGFEKRVYDPRSGYYGITYQDYATPIESSLVKRFIVRHRLVKKNAKEKVSEPVEPIVYYLDRGAPEPVRSALLEGASWWNQAFEAAGFKDAFQVKLLPEDAHPLDVRYNVIQWVHRSTRGWSYGASVVDPRTGEIIKGHVSLGSLRVRQDFLIAQGLLNQYDEGTEEMKEMALARIRQLSAHEVGHTLGLVHNYASSVNNRASVMDYPHPVAELDDNGNISLENAYDTNIGEWDKVTITYGYGSFENDQALAQFLTDQFKNGSLFISDRDARARDGAHPMAHLWDNGESAAAELNRMLDVRKVALSNLSEKSLPTGSPYSSLEEIMVPMYLFHRYQVEAASKVVGGLYYTYATKGDGQTITKFVSKQEQMDALNALIRSLSPAELKLREELVQMIPPKAQGYRRGREVFASKTGPVWDYYTAVETAAQLPLQFLLMPERANRLVVFADRDSDQPGLQLVLNTLIDKTWKAPASTDPDRAIQRIVEWKMLKYLMNMVHSDEAISDVKAQGLVALKNIQKFAESRRTSNAEDKAHYQLVAETIEKWLDDPEEIKLPSDPKTPDGSPIGTDLMEYCGN